MTGCGKSTFMRRMTGIFGGSPKPPAGKPFVELRALSVFSAMNCGP